MRKKIFIFSFLVVIYGLLLMYPINYLLVRKGKINITNFYVSNPNISNNKLSFISNPLNRIKASITSKSVNYLFMYDQVNELNKKVNAKLNEKLYQLLNKDYYPVSTNNDNEYVFRNNEKYVIYNNLSNDDLNNRLDEQIKFFNSLDTNINIFIPYRYEYLNLNNDINIRNMDNYRTKFINNINSNIKVSEFKVDNEADYQKYFYKTDHHYNMDGALLSYYQILEMLNKKDNKSYQVTAHKINYLGSMAKSSYLKDINDNFYTSDFNLNNYDILVDGKINDTYKPKDIKISSNPFYDEYVHYYNGLFGLVTYDFHKNNNDNLLILEDSYGWQIDDLIASHYDKTYRIDLRYYNFNNSKLSLNEFIKENNIKDVLFIYEAGSIFFDQYDYGMKDKVTK